ncbi:MAG: aminotransferase class I/II-fold pyridoxal phosphate-dependent enzyme [Clostridiales bacterium]|jgi:threonine-phosphate decarboxylase|nr:aminotransferase class I/II-fold pyridoxal phosphate-dependent enzyme [Clostridiales bacterium]
MHRYEHGGNIREGAEFMLDFSVNTNCLGMPESVKNAIARHIPEYARYPDPFCAALRRALAERHELEPSVILCGNGAAQLIFSLCACVKPRRALTLAPTFSEYERSVKLFGGVVSEHRLLESNGFALNESILTELDARLDIVFLCNPNNPTGRLTERGLLCEIADICRNNGTLLVVDECFIDFTRGESMLPMLRRYPHMLILRAFTKIYSMAGLRLGTLYCADRALLSRIAEYSPAWSVSAVAQTAGAAALKENGWIDRTAPAVETERAFMTAALIGLGLTVYDSDANFLLIKSKLPLCPPLAERNVLVRDCANFTGLDKRYIRAGLKSRDENMVLLCAVREILNG